MLTNGICTSVCEGKYQQDLNTNRYISFMTIAITLHVPFTIWLGINCYFTPREFCFSPVQIGGFSLLVTARLLRRPCRFEQFFDPNVLYSSPGFQFMATFLRVPTTSNITVTFISHNLFSFIIVVNFLRFFPTSVWVTASISWVVGDIRLLSTKNLLWLLRTHGAVDKAFDWKVLLGEIIWRLQV